MKIDCENNKVLFDDSDKYFIKKFGEEAAESMVLDFTSNHCTPFVYDVHQLSRLLRVKRKELFEASNNSDFMYRKLYIPKRNGKKRRIFAPDEGLKNIQKAILREFLDKLPISEYAMAYRKGATLRDNALPHTGKKNLLKIDIKDFFGSITFFDVKRIVFNTSIVPTNIGVMLSAICTKDDMLPQGAPTSPAISNIIMKHFDDVMGLWCKKRGIAYTRYCDDMTFSGEGNLFGAYKMAKDFLESMGFELNEEKTRFLDMAECRTVTGVVVNEFPQVSREERRRIRQSVYYAEKYGLQDAIDKCGLQEFTPCSYLAHLKSKVAYVLQINPDDKEFCQAAEKLKKLHIM